MQVGEGVEVEEGFELEEEEARDESEWRARLRQGKGLVGSEEGGERGGEVAPGLREDGRRKALAQALEEFALGDCVEEVAALGVQDIEDLGILSQQDAVAAGSSLRLSRMQLRRLMEAMAKQRRSNASSHRQMQLAVPLWSRLCQAKGG